MVSRGIVRPGGRVTRSRNAVDCKSRTQFAKLKFVVSRGGREEESVEEGVAHRKDVAAFY